MNKHYTIALVACSLFTAGIVSAQNPPPPPAPEGPCNADCRPMPPPPPMCPGNKDGKDMNGKHLEKFLEQLPETERAKMKELAEKDPRAFRQAVRNYFRERQKKEMENILALRKAYLEAPEGEKKEAAKAELRKKLEEGFQRHLDASDRRIKNMEKQLKNLQDGLDAAKKRQEEQKANKDKILDKVLADVTDPAKSPFPPPPPCDGKKDGGPRGNMQPGSLPPPPPHGEHQHHGNH